MRSTDVKKGPNKWLSVKTATWFYSLRFLLGVFEAGLYPGAILYLTYWFPARHRACIVALFFLAAPLSVILGGPISGWIMHAMGGQAGLASSCLSGCFSKPPDVVVGNNAWAAAFRRARESVAPALRGNAWSWPELEAGGHYKPSNMASVAARV